MPVRSDLTECWWVYWSVINCTTRFLGLVFMLLEKLEKGKGRMKIHLSVEVILNRFSFLYSLLWKTILYIMQCYWEEHSQGLLCFSWSVLLNCHLPYISKRVTLNYIFMSNIEIGLTFYIRLRLSESKYIHCKCVSKRRTYVWEV